MDETFGQYIKQLREENGYSTKKVELITERLPEEQHISKSYLSALERDKKPPPSSEKLQGLAKAYGLNYEDLMAKAGYLPGRAVERKEEYKVKGPTLSYEELLRALEAEPAVPVPIVDQLVHAGEGAVLMGITYVAKSLAQNKNLRAVVVRGDCMDPLIKPNDVIVVDLEGSPRPGDVVVAVINHEDVQVKRFKEKTNSHIVLSSENAKYADIEVSDLNILGVVIEVNRKIRRY